MRLAADRPVAGAEPDTHRVARHPTAAVLLLARDGAGCEQGALDRLLPGRALLPLPRGEVRGLRTMALVRRLRSLGADEIVILVDDLNSHEAIGRLLALLALPLAPRRVLLDRSGRRLRVSLGRFLARDLPFLAIGYAMSSVGLLRARARLLRLSRAPRRAPRPARTRRLCYLRSELWSGIEAGGSVGHTAGVASGLMAQGCEVDFVATSRPAAIDPGRHAIRVVPPRRLYTVRRELPAILHSPVFERGAREHLAKRPAGLLYQRFDPAGIAGVALSRALGLPFVLEYNGPEVWIADHWGRPLKRRRLFETIERVNLRHADLVSVVSGALRDRLVAQGVASDRIVVLPNGVDTTLYTPDRDGGAVRRRHGLQGLTVLGFIGTFEAWHGAEVLARAAARLLPDVPRAAVLFVGDGPARPASEAILRASRCGDRVVFTGLVPQREGAEHLASMDILVAPHVPNADGSRFFGSPTKLFEYMAMGRAIVASRLEPMSDLLEDGRTALLVPPGDDAALARAIRRLIDDAGLRAELGAAARAHAVERHTWGARAGALLARLSDMGLIAWS